MRRKEFFSVFDCCGKVIKRLKGGRNGKGCCFCNNEEPHTNFITLNKVHILISKSSCLDLYS